MEPKTEPARLIPISGLRACMVNAFARVGIPAEFGEQIATMLLDGELRGHESHGVHLVRYVTEEVRRGVLNAQPNITTVHETSEALLLDGDRGIVVPAVQAMRWCLERVKAGSPMAVAGVRNCQPVALGFYVRMAAEAGMLGFACTNAIPSVAPPGGRTATVGTNPFAYGVPTGHHGAVVFDAATTALAGMAVQLAAEDGRELPRDVLLDQDGYPTTDPSARSRGGSMAPLGYPAAAHKGFGLAVMVEILAAVLTGAAIGRDLLDSPGRFGCTVWALDPAPFMPLPQFHRRMDELVEQIKQGDRMDSVVELPVPGERGERRFKELTDQGAVRLSARTWNALTQVCESLDVQLPGEAGSV